MRVNFLTAVALTSMIPIAGVSQAPSSADVLRQATAESKTRADLNQLVGVWHGEHNELPWVTVTLTYEGGVLSGAILFYLHRKMPGTAETATAGAPEPLLNPHFDGKTLTFQVSHRHAHAPASLDDPPIAMTMQLIDPDHVRLVNLEDEHLTGLLTRTWP